MKVINISRLKRYAVYISLLTIMGVCIVKTLNLDDLGKDKEDVLASSANLEEIASLSNKKIGWEIKRADNHEQPDLGSKNKDLMNQYNGICMGNNKDPFI